MFLVFSSLKMMSYFTDNKLIVLLGGIYVFKALFRNVKKNRKCYFLYFSSLAYELSIQVA